MDDRRVLHDKNVPFGCSLVLKHPFFTLVSFTQAESDEVIKLIKKAPVSTFSCRIILNEFQH